MPSLNASVVVLFVVFSGNLFQSFIVLQKKENLYLSLLHWICLKVRLWVDRVLPLTLLHWICLKVRLWVDRVL